MTEMQFRRFIIHSIVLTIVIVGNMAFLSIIQMNHTDKAIAELKAEWRKP